MGGAIKSLMAVAALAGVLAFGSGARRRPRHPAENAAPSRQCRDAYDIPETRPIAPVERTQAQLDRQGFYKAFPPAGIEVVSWYVMMGIGQVVTLRLPASRLREVNRIIENTAWGSHRTEFYPTYDYKAIGIGARQGAGAVARFIARLDRRSPLPRGREVNHACLVSPPFASG